MCLVLPARVLAVAGQSAEIELTGGKRVSVDITLCPDVAVDQYVLFDRGMVLEVISAEEAAAILEMYEQIGQLLADADGAAVSEFMLLGSPVGAGAP
ncbi:MAG: HypC/HybG/HupF family hydrogenase formation chaperone [Chloroflexota bacterium]